MAKRLKTGAEGKVMWVIQLYNAGFLTKEEAIEMLLEDVSE